MDKSLIIKKSPGKGRGVFAGKDFMKGKIIERCHVIVLPQKEIDILDRTKLYDYYFLWGKKLDQAALLLGYGELYNHSYKSNAIFRRDFKKNCMVFVSVRDIKKGEEITINYNGIHNDPTPFEIKRKR